MQNLIHYYYQQANDRHLIEDPYHLEIIKLLQHIGDKAVQENKLRHSLARYVRSKKAVKGLYLWGNVGAGKTFLISVFFDWLPIKEKMRIHFNAFMRLVHESLKSNQGKKNPLQLFAKQLAKTTQLICFDELIVADIVDAVLLAELFNALIDNKITLLFTSNSAPDDLYKRGLLRERFLPTIALLKAHTKIIHLNNHQDYRLRHLNKAGVFFLTNDPDHDKKMDELFLQLNSDYAVFYNTLNINNRPIKTIKYSEQMVWFDFEVLCNVPRSDKDYLTIAETFKTVLISHIPVIKAEEHNKAILFIRLIDILYDYHTRLIFSAAATVDKLYPEGNLHLIYQRTCSRLIEMQSKAYFMVD